MGECTGTEGERRPPDRGGSGREGSVADGRAGFPGEGGWMMRIRRAGASVVAVVGVGLMMAAAAPAARAQVKLEYKFPEGQTLTYKSTSKMNQILTLNGMEFPTDVEQSVVTSQAI